MMRKNCESTRTKPQRAEQSVGCTNLRQLLGSQSITKKVFLTV